MTAQLFAVPSKAEFASALPRNDPLVGNAKYNVPPIIATFSPDQYKASLDADETG